MSENSAIRPEDMETAKQVLMAVGKVELEELPTYDVDLYRGAWLAIDKSGVEPDDGMLWILGIIHYRIQDEDVITPELLEEKHGKVLKWSI